MKKIFTALTATLLTAAMYGEGLPVPYSSTVGDQSTKTLCHGWTIIDIDSDGEETPSSSGDTKGKWSYSDNSSEFSGSETKYGAMYKYHSTHAANDWLISPAIHLEAGKEYKVRFHSRAKGSNENLRVTLAGANDAESLAAGQTLFDMAPVSPADSWVKRAFTVTVPADGEYYVGFYAYSPANKWYIDINNFSVTENVVIPSRPTNIAYQTGSPSAPRERKVVLTWTNPTTDLDGVDLPEDMAVSQINIKRDGVQVAALTTPVETWTDTEATGLTDGIHTYAVSAICGTVESDAAEITTSRVGLPESKNVPYNSDFNSSGYNKDRFSEEWTNAKGAASNVNTNWEFSSTYLYGNRLSFRVYTADITDGADKVTEDAWVFSPPIYLPAAGTYEVITTTAVNSKTATYSPKLQLYAGNAPAVDAMNIVVSEELDLPEKTSKPENPNTPLSITVTEPGNYVFGFRAAAENVTIGANYYIYDLKVNAYVVKPAPVSDLTVTEDADYGLGATLSWTNPTTTSVGEALTGSYLVTINRDGEQAAQFTNTVGGQETATFHDTYEKAGSYTYTVTTSSVTGEASDNGTVTVTTPWIGPDNVDLPYAINFAESSPSLDLWKVIDHNNDGYTWAYVASTGYRLNQGQYDDGWTDDTYGDNDDYLVSPRMYLTPGSYTFTIKAKGDNQNFYIGLVDDVNKVTSKTKYITTQNCKTTNVVKTFTLNVDITEAKDYWFSISCNELNDYVSNYYKLVVSEFSAVHNLILPTAATDLTVTPAAAPALEATIAWTNPTTTNIEGTALESIAKAVVYRNGEVIGEVTTGLVPGERSQYVDSAVPESGIYTYSVAIHSADGANEAPNPEVTSAWIGGGIDLPYESDDFSDWTILNVNDDYRVVPDPDNGDIREPRTWIYGYNGLAIDSQVSNGTTDDWAISPRILFEEGKTYAITVTSFVGMGNTLGYIFDLAVGPDTNPDNMSTIAAITTNAQLKKDAQTDTFHVKAVSADTPAEASETEVATINVPAGVSTIGMHAYNKGAVSVNKVTVTEYNDVVSGIDSSLSDTVISQNGDTLIVGADVNHVDIYDLQGRRVAGADNNGAGISIAGLQKGIYVIVLHDAGGNRAVKFAIR